MVFADRGIYRPGETVYLTAALRRGHSNALRIPAPGDSVRLRIRHQMPGEREPATVRDTVLRVNDYGTVSDSLVLGRTWTLGTYSVDVDATVYDRWKTAGAESFQVAEYRAPEFETSLTLDSTARYLGDTLRARATGRYYFGAPMSGAVIHWSAYIADTRDDFTVPGLPTGFSIGETYVGGEPQPGHSETLAGVDTLDGTGSVQLRIPTRPDSTAWPARVDVSVSVDDLNRQSVSSEESMVLHGSNLYLAVRDSSPSWYWLPNEPRRFEYVVRRDVVRQIVNGGVATRRDDALHRRHVGIAIAEVGQENDAPHAVTILRACFPPFRRRRSGCWSSRAFPSAAR